MDEYLTPKQVASLLQLTERTLANQRHEGRGIPYVKVERAVRYRRLDIERYLKNEAVKPVIVKNNMDIEEGTNDDA